MLKVITEEKVINVFVTGGRGAQGLPGPTGPQGPGSNIDEILMAYLKCK